MISRVPLAVHRTAALSCVLVAFLLSSGQSSRAQDGVNEERAISGNNATIVVNVRDNSGAPLPVSAVVKLFRNGTIPNGQATTAQGRAILLPQNLGGFSVDSVPPRCLAGFKEARQLSVGPSSVSLQTVPNLV